VDVLRGDSPVQKNLIDFGLYLTFFPQITAGPIVRYRDFEPQLKNHPVTLQKVSYGLTRFGIGLFKKVLIADLLAQISARVQFYEEPSALAAWIGALAFTFEIYFDFSGYSDMAIGLSEVFGFKTPENFLHPYESLSVSEFWRRWHVTLGAWFREYIYIPLGGNRRGTARTIWNLFVVWLLTGFWHGASWNFVLWGLYYGILIMLEKFPLKNFWGRLPKGICWFYAFLAEVLGWVVFSHTDLVRAVSALGAMFGSAPGIDSLGLYLLSTAWPLLLISAVFCTEFPHRLFLKMCRSVPGKIIWSAGFAVLLLLSLSAMAGNGFTTFLYAKF
jgi:alginate O-acetyltransferase complex protein AlgI